MDKNPKFRYGAVVSLPSLTKVDGTLIYPKQLFFAHTLHIFDISHRPQLLTEDGIIAITRGDLFATGCNFGNFAHVEN
jgi:hypothetical protein